MLDIIRKFTVRYDGKERTGLTKGKKYVVIGVISDGGIEKLMVRGDNSKICKIDEKDVYVTFIEDVDKETDVIKTVIKQEEPVVDNRTEEDIRTDDIIDELTTDRRKSKKNS